MRIVFAEPQAGHITAWFIDNWFIRNLNGGRVHWILKICLFELTTKDGRMSPMLTPPALLWIAYCYAINL